MSDRSLISLFSRHRVLANLLMVLLLFLGAFSLFKLNRQLLPTVDFRVVTVSVNWPTATPSEVEQAITVPIENEIQQISNIRSMSSVSSQGNALIIIKFDQDANMSEVVQELRDAVSQVRTMPEDARKPRINRARQFEAIARIIIVNKNLVRLRYWARQFRQQLLDLGIAKVDVNGLPQRQISIDIPPEQLAHLKLTLPQIGQQVAQSSKNVSVGKIASQSVGYQLRSQAKAKTLHQFERLPIISGDSSNVVQLLNIATIKERHSSDAPYIMYHGKKAIDLTLYRSASTDSLHSAELMYRWLKKTRQHLPEGMKLHVYNEMWTYIQQRIDLLLKNGATGMALIFILLFLFLNVRVAGWVAAGIPIAIAAALFILLLTDSSINMLSLFALIMALGIIVDDTIVVAEESVSQFEQGNSPLQAVIKGAKRMRTPLFASSLTTVAAFLPLLLLGGIYGKIMIAIPIVIICVIIASLVESFLILPYHLKNSLNIMAHNDTHPLRVRIQNGFVKLRDQYFRRLVNAAINRSGLTLCLTFISILLALGCVIGGHINFTFFPSTEGTMIHADITFVAGTGLEKKQQFIEQMERSAWKADKVLNGHDRRFIRTAVAFLHKGTNRYKVQAKDRLASLMVEVLSPNDRTITNAQFIKQWYQEIKRPPWVERIEIRSPKKGPQGSDIDIGLYGLPAAQLKSAATELTAKLGGYKGVYNVSDNLSYGQKEIIFHLKPSAKALGLTTKMIGDQLHSAFSGYLAQIFYDQDQEVEVRLRLSERVRNKLSSLQTLPIITASNQAVPLGSLVTMTTKKSFDLLRRQDNQLSVNVLAEVDASQGNARKIFHDVITHYLPILQERYGVKFSLKGRKADQDRTVKEMKYALLITLALIYMILAAVSSSYLWPLFVMVAIPLGLEGAIFGHWLLGRDLTLLSLFGFFGLMGIVINDSIILLFRYHELLNDGLKKREAIVEACCQRFRAVILTSLTTIAGLTPILFERSLQAQFLIPMAISLCFGLLFSTVLILVVIPVLVSLFDRKKIRIISTKQPNTA